MNRFQSKHISEKIINAFLTLWVKNKFLLWAKNVIFPFSILRFSKKALNGFVLMIAAG